MKESNKSLWQLLWDYDPNGLVVVDLDMKITVVNQAFCDMVKKTEKELIGVSAEKVFGDDDDFKLVWENNRIIKAQEKVYPQYDLCVRRVMFPIQDQQIVACIMVDVTHEAKQKEKMAHLKEQTIEKVHQVVDRQMHVVQEIAGLLGETTAETKVSLLKLIEMVKSGEE